MSIQKTSFALKVVSAGAGLLNWAIWTRANGRSTSFLTVSRFIPSVSDRAADMSYRSIMLAAIVRFQQCFGVPDQTVPIVSVRDDVAFIRNEIVDQMPGGVLGSCNMV